MDPISEIIYPAVDEAKQIIPSAASLERRADSPLFGQGGLDSLGLVQFIVMVEERIEDQTGLQITLASDKAMSRKSSPFQTLESLATYIEECLTEAGYGG